MNRASTYPTSPPPAAAEDSVAELAARLSPASRLSRDVPMAPRTTLRVGGPADLLIEPADEADLAEVLRFCHERRQPWRVLGRGSNLLVRDGGVREWVVALTQPEFQRIEVRGTHLCCGAGVRLKALAGAALQHGLAGLEFLEGIPGSVGGALRMNAGAHAAWTFEVVERVSGLDTAGHSGEWLPADLSPGYRECEFLKTHLATGAVFCGEPDESAAIRARMETFKTRRRGSQPRESSGGCVFKNPATGSAGEVIDDLGLKGLRVGGAMISPVHGNFIVNLGEATADDVLALIAQARERAFAVAGVALETEIEIWGEDRPANR